MTRARISAKAASFTESVIREMNRLAVAAGAVNLAQGFPDFPARPSSRTRPRERHPRRRQPVRDHVGRARPLRDAIAAKTAAHFPGWDAIDPETEITVTCGATEAMIAAMLGAARPGRRGHRLRAVLRELRARTRSCPARVPRYVTLHEPDWSFDPDELRAAFRPRTRGDRRSTRRTTRPARSSRATSSSSIADAVRRARRHRLHRRDLRAHRATTASTSRWRRCPGMAERTVTINSLSKTYSVTGWRVGWVIAPPDLTRRRSAASTTS